MKWQATEMNPESEDVLQLFKVEDTYDSPAPTALSDSFLIARLGDLNRK